eukprot:6582609-Ditylum_brightwellii.AAC.1
MVETTAVVLVDCCILISFTALWSPVTQLSAVVFVRVFVLSFAKCGDGENCHKCREETRSRVRTLPPVYEGNKGQ